VFGQFVFSHVLIVAVLALEFLLFPPFLRVKPERVSLHVVLSRETLFAKLTWKPHFDFELFLISAFFSMNPEGVLLHVVLTRESLVTKVTWKPHSF